MNIKKFFPFDHPDLTFARSEKRIFPTELDNKDIDDYARRDNNNPLTNTYISRNKKKQKNKNKVTPIKLLNII